MNAPLKVSGIDHVVFHVKDLARARKFYVDFLGLEVEHERDWQCFLKCGNQGIALFEVDDAKKCTAAARSIIWRCGSTRANTNGSKRHWRTRALKSAAVRAIRIASTSTIPMAISCSSNAQRITGRSSRAEKNFTLGRAVTAFALYRIDPFQPFQ